MTGDRRDSVGGAGWEVAHVAIDDHSRAGFVQTCLRERAYGRAWANSAERTAWLPAFLAYYNARRPHSALGYRPPASRLFGNNVLKLNN